MPIFPLQVTQTLATSGGTVTIDVTKPLTEYIFDGSGTMSSSWTIAASATPTRPTTIKIFYNCNFALNGHSFTILGNKLNVQQALAGNVIIEATYDLVAAAWVVVIKQSDSDITPTVQGVKTTTLTSGGGTLTLVPGRDYEWQELVGSATLSASWTVTAPVAAGGTTAGYFYVHYTGTLTPSGNTVTIFGITLTDAQVTNGNVLVCAYYDSPNNVWRSQLIAQPNDIDYKGVTNTTITGFTGVTVTLQNGVSKQFQRLTGSGALGGNCLVTSTGTFADGATFFIEYDATTTGHSVSILGETLSAYQQQYGKCMVIAVYDLANTTFRTQLVQNPNQGAIQKEVITIPVSFESGLQSNNYFVVPYNATILQLDAFVTKALTGTDAGTITTKIGGTSVTNGVVTVPLSSALDTQVSATPTALNTITAGQIISALTQKTTSGGACLLSITLLRTA